MSRRITLSHDRGPPAGSALVTGYMLRLLAKPLAGTLLLGSPAFLRERIAGLAALGFNHLIFRPWWLGMPHDMAKRSIELFAEEVMPAFAD